MSFQCKMLCICLFLSLLFNSVLSFQICAFNVKSFGEAKRTQPEIMDIIIKVISRCDIMLLMEIKDSSNRICPFLLAKLNSQKQDEYKYVVSSRLGRKTYKEQYAFFYRSKMVRVKKTYQYPDLQPGDEDALSREPFVVWFYSPKTVTREFVIIPLHTTPETSVREIDELYDVYLDVKQLWKTENFIFMGDFNAGCGYVARKHWKNIRLRNHTEFVWLIDDKSDTTVRASTFCPYDRIVLHGDKLIRATVPNSTNIFDFQRAFSMTEEQGPLQEEPVLWTSAEKLYPDPVMAAANTHSVAVHVSEIDQEGPRYIVYYKNTCKALGKNHTFKDSAKSTHFNLQRGLNKP